MSMDEESDRGKIDGPPLTRQADLADWVFGQLIDMIVSGRLAPGSKVNALELSRQLGVSRGPIREAVRRLEERQLVTNVPNFGARVVAHTPEQILEAYQLREIFEGLAARLAATNMTDEERALARIAFEEEITRGESKDYASDFHMHIARGSHSSELIRILNEDYYRLIKLWQTTNRWLASGGQQSRIEHERILDAIEHRDPECAELLTRRHLVRLREKSIERLESLRASNVTALGDVIQARKSGLRRKA